MKRKPKRPAPVPIGVVASLAIRVNRNTAAFTRELQGLEKTWGSLGKKLQAIGTGLKP